IMKPTPFSRFFLAAIFLALSGALTAAEGGGEDVKMRAMLRDLTLQLRTAQSDLSSAQATQATLTAQNKELTEKYETLRKQAAADRTAGEKTSTTLTTQVGDLKSQVAKLTTALQTAKAENDKLLVAGRTAEEQRVKLSGEAADLRQRL